MGRLPVPDLPPGPRRELADALDELHLYAGQPSLRTLARAAGCSHTTVSSAFSLPQLPKWGLLELLVEAMDGDVETFRHLWIAASSDEQPSEGSTRSRDRRVGKPLVGRSAECDRVHQHVLAGRGGLMLVIGAAGIGKSSLVQAVSGAAAPQVFFATGACLPRGHDLPLLPVVAALRTVSAIDNGSWLAESLARTAPYVTVELGRLLPELATEPAPSRPYPDAFARPRQFAAVSDTLAALAVRQKLALVLEDLHWADSATLEILDYLLANLDRSQMPIIGTFRTDEQSPLDDVEAWRSRASTLPGVTTLPLTHLNLPQTARQIATLTGQNPALGDVQRIYKRSQGNPLFTELLALHDEHTNLPDELAGILDRRFAELSADAWAVCCALATLQRPATTGQLKKMIRLRHDALTNALRELSQRHLVSVVDGGARVAMRHPLLSEAAQRLMIPAEIDRAHSRAARTLDGWRDVPAAEIADHWQAACRYGKELTWRIRAARESGDRHAYAHEAVQWSRALDLWPSVANPDTDNTPLLEIYCAAMDAWDAAGDSSAARGLAEQVLPHLDPTTPSQTAGEVHRRAGTLIGITDPKEGERLLQTALNDFVNHVGRSGHLRALTQLAALNRGQGRYLEAGALIAEAARLTDESTDPALRRTILGTDAWHRMHAGAVEQAQRRLQEASLITPVPADPAGDIWLAVMLTDCLLKAGGTFDQTGRVGEAGLAAIHDWDLHSFQASLLVANVSQLLIRAGHVERAAGIVDQRTNSAATLATWAEHNERARLDMLRGRTEPARTRLDQLTSLPITSLSFRVEIATVDIEWLLWQGRSADAFQTATSLLRTVLPTAESQFAGRLLTLAARAAADVAHHHDTATEPISHELTALTSLRASSPIDPFNPKPIPYDAAAWAATWIAEQSRLRHEMTPRPWAAATAHWDALARPHEAAYCRWRFSQALLASPTTAHQARPQLRRAARDAQQHQPLLTHLHHLQHM